ncbi:uncharacterized protein LOC117182294 isoform X2 [Belonocnema kinseyi]|uniref:uncharacterized protein LOC117182294 isoform X2 n=1 Tax=Belonocnema kinseyi TaxID=2817044 RepID=UPI00143DB14F|nr:uncharacterized protein LOC117182294 isoform X2 [Belonocnema kinseyi]
MNSKSEEKCDLPIILGTTVFDQDGSVKSIVFPFTRQSDDKVEILPSTNVWIFKNDFYTVKAISLNLCSSNRHSEMINILLSRLIGEENLQYLSWRKWLTLMELPEIIKFVIKTFTKGNCLPQCTYSTKQMQTFTQGVFKNSRRYVAGKMHTKENGGGIKEEDEIDILSDNRNEEKTLELYKTYDNITFPYMIPSEEKIELVQGYNVWISRIELETIYIKCFTIPCFSKHRTMIRLLFEELLGIENMRYMSIGGSKIRQETRKYMKLPEEIYSAVLAYNIQHCNSLNCGNAFFNSHGYHDFVTYILSQARQGISRKNKLKQNEIGSKTEKEDILFPCIMQNEDKVELVRGSNVWISKNDLWEIEEKCNVLSCESKHQKMMYYLLNILLSTENLSIAGNKFGKNNYFRLPKELTTAVIVYATRKCKAINCDALSSDYNSYVSSIINHARAISERRNSNGFENNNEMPYISNTEENISFAESKREHSLDKNSFARTFVKLEINSTQTPTIRKRGHEDEENDSTIRNKRTKLSENTAIRDLENYCSTSYDQILLNHFPSSASPNLKNDCNVSYDSRLLKNISEFAPQNVQTYWTRNGSYNQIRLNHVSASLSKNLKKYCKVSYKQIPLNNAPSFASPNLKNFRKFSYNTSRLNNVATSVSQNVEKNCKGSYNEIPVNHGPSALKNLENFCDRSFVSIPSNHVSAFANVTGNLYKPAGIPPNVAADYYYEAVYNSFLVNYLQSVVEHNV